MRSLSCSLATFSRMRATTARTNCAIPVASTTMTNTRIISTTCSTRQATGLPRGVTTRLTGGSARTGRGSRRTCYSTPRAASSSSLNCGRTSARRSCRASLTTSVISPSHASSIQMTRSTLYLKIWRCRAAMCSPTSSARRRTITSNLARTTTSGVCYLALLRRD